MAYCFRIRFTLGPRVRIKTDAEELVFSSEAVDSESVVLRGRLPDVPLGEAQELVLRGERYRTEEDAERAAYEWLARVRTAFARLRIGADFGERRPRTSHFTEYGLRALFPAGRVLNDDQGVMVFECDPPPQFAAWGASLQVNKPADQLVDLVRRARSKLAAPDDREGLAYSLFSTSFFEHSADARFVTLMMAVETLSDPQPRHAEAAAHVERLIAATQQAAELSDAERLSLLGALQGLRRESARKAGRRLAESLGDRKYMDESAVRFFDRCYDMRGALVHGHYPRPEWSAIDTRAATLEQFVGDLLSAAAFANDRADV